MQVSLFPMKNNFECIGVIEIIRKKERPLEFEYADLIQNMTEEQIFNAACSSTNILTNYQIYRRWDLAYMKKPKPRKPVLRNFDINEFKNKFKPINQ